MTKNTENLYVFEISCWPKFDVETTINHRIQCFKVYKRAAIIYLYMIR